DDIVGVVIARQLLLTEPGDEEEFESIIRNVQFVPELQRADQLLVQFRKTGTTLAIAVDEYGGTAGLVTLEDLVERMVGDITGPREQSEAPDVQPLENDEYRVNADLPVRDWLDTFSPRGEAALFAPDVATLGGIVMARLGEVPEEGDEIDLGNLRITVETMDGARLLWLKVRLREGGDPA
ncbi:MAG: transporter associated domain-containing protein, partial [Phycisphaeraceae bacterium]|nr:transporter associated domain-containing protein [Phycisphaeraceae bacterium]